MEKAITLSIVTPEGILFDAPVEYVGVPGTLGDFGVFPGHASLLSSVRIGCLSYKEEGKSVNIFVGGGFVDVTKEKITVLADSATPSELIDVDRATKAKERAEARLREKAEGLDEVRAMAALERAIARLQIASLGAR